MKLKADHGYAALGTTAKQHFTCTCGHVESFDGDADLNKALERMNAHIRSSYTDEEWAEKMQKTKLAMLDSMTGVMKMPPEGPKS